MAKRSRRPVRGEPAASRPETSSGNRPATSSPGSRVTRTTRPRRVARPSLLERYRTLLVSGAAVIGLLIVGWLFFQSSAAAYTCDSLLTPGPVESLTPRPATPTPGPSASPSPAESPSPTASDSPAASGSPAASPAASGSPVPSASPSPSPSPAPEPTPRLGFTTTILGREHVRDPNQTINYAFCPPTSGNHYEQPRGPLRPAVYPSNEEQAPGGWIHNLEHGYVVALYRCSGPDDCASEAELAQLQAFFDQAPTSVNPACPTKVVVARLDSMDTRFALIAWGRALLLDEFDLDTALTFAQQWMDHEAVPERGAC